MRFLLDFLFPSSSSIDLDNLPPALATGDPSVIALFEYQHQEVKKLVWEIKYKGNRELAKRVGILLNDVLQSELAERGIWAEDVILVPVPMSVERMLKRGWNQAELIAQAIGLPSLPNILVKVRATDSQKQAGSRSERLKNLTNSMKVENTQLIQNKVVVVIDDVTTTGATFNEARRALRAARPRKILCLAVAH